MTTFIHGKLAMTNSEAKTIKNIVSNFGKNGDRFILPALKNKGVFSRDLGSEPKNRKIKPKTRISCSSPNIVF